jgi:hypothetical protein
MPAMLRDMRWIVIAASVALAGCNGRSPAPAPSSTVPAGTQPPAQAIVQLSGRVLATVTGEPLAGIAVDIGGQQTTTDASGAFSVPWDLGGRASSGRATLTGPAILTRGLTIATSTSRDLSLDAIPLAHGFDLTYYRKLVRNTSDAPDGMRALRRWTTAPRVYIRTVDEAGTPIDDATLAATEAALGDDASAWTGGRFGLVEIVRGPESREGRSGWITVKWPNPANEGNNCGRAQVGVDGGWIELNYLNRICACGAARVGPGIVRHELGHAFGFFHTGEPTDLLKSTLDTQTLCAGRASARERYHAAIAYSRPIGNTDPDNDPTTTIQRRDLEPIVIVD